MFTVSNIGQAATKLGVCACKLFRTSALFFAFLVTSVLNQYKIRLLSVLKCFF